MGSACRWAMSSRGERAHTASQRAGERAVRSGACGEDGGAWAAGAPGSRASSATSRASAPRRRPACSSSWRALGRHGHGALGLEHRHISSSYVALVCVKKHNARGQAHGLARDRAARCFDCMAEAGTAALAGHSPRVDAPPLRGRARRVADAGDGPAGTEKAIRRRCEPPSVADGDGRIHNIGMTFVYHSHIM